MCDGITFSLCEADRRLFSDIAAAPLGSQKHKRHGTPPLFAALNVWDGTVSGRTMPLGIHPLPQPDQAPGAEGQGHPRHSQQLQGAQEGQGPGWLARHPR